jgi:hypothetical protein
MNTINQTLLKKSEKSVGVAATRLPVGVGQIDADSDEFRIAVMCAIRHELSDDTVNEFVSIVDDAYKKSFIEQYSEYTPIGGFLVDRNSIRRMYGSMVRLFPLLHRGGHKSTSGWCIERLGVLRWRTI